jgi:hypothetical protein
MIEKVTNAKFHNSSFFRNTVRMIISEKDGIPTAKKCTQNNGRYSLKRVSRWRCDSVVTDDDEIQCEGGLDYPGSG